LGADFTIRRTANAGQSWTTVVPQNTAQAPTDDYTTVWTTANNAGVVLGDGDGYAITANQATLNTSLPTDVKAATRVGNNLYAVSTSNIHRIVIPSLVSSNIATFTGTARTIQAHPSGGFAVAGESGLFRYYDNTETFVFSQAISTADVNALAVIDNTYLVAVGDNGAYYKSINAQVDPQGNLTGLNWQQKTGTFDSDPYHVTAANQAHIYTIAFATATNAVFGGEYTVNFTTNPITQTYVRSLFDPNARFANRFFYDKLGRLVVSQNARQFNLLDVFGNPKDRKYSYTLYDGLGRVVEVGEKTENTSASDHFASVFGTQVSGYYNPSVMDDAKLLAWINGDGARKEVTKSYYDETLITGLPGDFTPNVLTQRKRIVHVTYEEEFDGNDQTFDHATHYDYDIHGNVNTLLQDNRKMAEDFASIATQRFKRMDYTYDLVSGNVHRMSVQNGEADQWHHAYRYDADNRITHTFTSAHTPLVAAETDFPQLLQNELGSNSDWQQEAAYFYYAHGPLARTEIGQDELQGVDYVYNLQGWMKGVNSTSLDETLDPGQDGESTSLNANFARDVYGFGLHYYEGDYLAINGTGQNHLAGIANSDVSANSFDLFNGNIKAMQTTITNPDTRVAMPMANAYKYDQLNRLLESKSFINLANNQWGNAGTYDNRYYNAFEYDPNGNIESQIRHTESGLKIEEMTYQYQKDGNGNLLRNRLYHINDAVADGVWADDIDDMGAFTTGVTINTDNNYSFDEEGRLIKDVQEGIEKIVWRVDGKVKEVIRVDTSSAKNLSFDYNAFGHRIAKHVYNNQTGLLEKTTYYLLDAQGHTMNVYEHEVDDQDVLFTLKEQHIYGSSALGIKMDTLNMFTATASNTVSTVLGQKYFHLKNHLSNNLTTINDIKIPVSSGTTVDYYDVGIVNIYDYSAFGVMLDGRTMESDFVRISFNGMERDDNVKGRGNSYDFGARMLDSRVGRWLSRDPLEDKYASLSPYIFVANTPIQAFDPDGRYIIFINGYNVEDIVVGPLLPGWSIGIRNPTAAKSLDLAQNAYDFSNASSHVGASYWQGFDIGTMKKWNDYKAQYVDGSPSILFIDINDDIRIKAGKEQGFTDAKAILYNLDENETIKIVTHSMGGAFGRGYVEGLAAGLEEQVRKHNERVDWIISQNELLGLNIDVPDKILTVPKIEIVVDIAPWSCCSEKGYEAVNGVPTYQMSGDSDTLSGETLWPGSTAIATKKGTGHSINEYSPENLPATKNDK
jgi:RHS repeat-associated protein